MVGDFRTRLLVRVFLKSPCSNCAKQTFMYSSIWYKDIKLDKYGINCKIKLINVPYNQHQDLFES